MQNTAYVLYGVSVDWSQTVSPPLQGGDRLTDQSALQTTVHIADVSLCWVPYPTKVSFIPACMTDVYGHKYTI
jgi:hypothetical protein